MPFDRTIEVIQPHSLGIEGAKARLLKLQAEQKGKNPHIESGDFAWHKATNTFTVDLLAYGAKVHIVVGIESDKVTVHSQEIGGFFALVWAGVMEAERQIQNLLAEALKP